MVFLYLVFISIIDLLNKYKKLKKACKTKIHLTYLLPYTLYFMFNLQYNHINKLTLKVVTLGCILLTTSCANFTTSTNLDRSNFEEYFAPSKVKIYKSVEELPQQRQYIGVIEGEDCQISERDEKVDLIDARTNARRIANKLEANAIIFSQCVNVKNRSCADLLICYAHAYKVIQE